MVRGGNYGWNVKEGAHCFDAANPETPPATCPDEGEFGEPLIDPVIEYENAKQGVGIVVVGGYVYRGSDIPGLTGLYVFGDYSRSFEEPDGLVLVADPSEPGPWPFAELGFGEAAERLGSYVLGFGQDLAGEVYVLTSQTGVPAGSTGRVLRFVIN